MLPRNLPLLASASPLVRRAAGVGVLTLTLWLSGVLSLFGAIGALFD